MEFTNRSQLNALVRIAAFSAALRGHRLAGWVESAESATAICATCNSSVTVYLSLFEPGMDGILRVRRAAWHASPHRLSETTGRLHSLDFAGCED